MLRHLYRGCVTLLLDPDAPLAKAVVVTGGVGDEVFVKNLAAHA